MTEYPKRWSDAQLSEFRSDFDRRMVELDVHMDADDIWKLEVINSMQQINTTIEKLEVKIENLERSTSGVVTLFSEASIGKKWLVRLGQLVLWVAAIYGGFKVLR